MASPYSPMQIAAVPAAAPSAAPRTQAQAALAQLADEDFAVLEDSDPVSASSFEVARTPMRRRGGTLRPGNFELPSFRQGRRMPGAVCG